MARKKSPKLESYRTPSAQLYTVEVYCHDGERMPSPVRRILNCQVVSNEQDELGTVVLVYSSGMQEECGRLILAHLSLRHDGIWVHGVEDHESSFKNEFQVWFLLPEPNQYSAT
jgi:hypothetical protein